MRPDRWPILPGRIVTLPRDDRHLAFAPLDLSRYLEFDVAEFAVSFAVERGVAETVTAAEAFDQPGEFSGHVIFIDLREDPARFGKVAADAVPQN